MILRDVVEKVDVKVAFELAQICLEYKDTDVSVLTTEQALKLIVSKQWRESWSVMQEMKVPPLLGNLLIFGTGPAWGPPGSIVFFVPWDRTS